MRFHQKVFIKLKTELNFLLLQKIGVPKIKNEKISKRIIKKLLPTSPVVIDCGAHNGSDSIELARILKGKVYSFEPNPTLFQKLLHNTRKYKNITCFPLALSASTGIQTFYLSGGASDASSSLLPPKEHLIDHPEIKFEKEIEVQTKTLDQWALDNQIGKVDLLWLDMQGSEMAMLQKSEKIIETVRLIHTEVSIRESYEGVPKYQEFKKWLELQGFKLVLEAIPTGWDMGNALFENKNPKHDT